MRFKVVTPPSLADQLEDLDREHGPFSVATPDRPANPLNPLGGAQRRLIEGNGHSRKQKRR